MNAKESIYTNIDECKEKEQAKLLKDEKSKYHHEIARKKGGNEKALVTKEMALSNLGKSIFIGDSAATSHMTSNKMGVSLSWFNCRVRMVYHSLNFDSHQP